MIRDDFSSVDVRFSTFTASNGDKRKDDQDGDNDDAPETPLDEPRPPRVQDPPPQPAPQVPYVVRPKNV